jgi:hypothetical protein
VARDGGAAVPAAWPVPAEGGGGRRGGQREAAASVGVVEGRKGKGAYILGFGERRAL